MSAMQSITSTIAPRTDMELHQPKDGLLYLNVCHESAKEYQRLSSILRYARIVLQGMSLVFDNDTGSRLPHPDANPYLWSEIAGNILRETIPELAHALRAAAASEVPAIVVRGLPAEATPAATPYGGLIDLNESRQAIINLYGVIECLGLTPIAYETEDVSILHAVAPRPDAGGLEASIGFDKKLPFHTDYADRPMTEAVTDLSPAAHALAFAVERPEPLVPMECLPVTKVVDQLTEAEKSVAQQEAFEILAPDIFRSQRRPCARPLLIADGNGGFYCRLNLAKTTPVTAAARSLVSRLHNLLAETQALPIGVLRGDIVVFHNSRVLHRRSSFRPRWDGTDRYFIRMSLVRRGSRQRGLARDPARPWLWR